jgi:Mini-chromosome maintenance replisome factor
LDGNLAERNAPAAAGDGQLVRIRGGFVQDMFPSEYFETSSSGKNDSSSNHCRRGGIHPTLAERTPLLIAPIPFSTPWFRNVLSEKQVEHRDKRARSNGGDGGGGGGGGDSSSSGGGGNIQNNNSMMMHDRTSNDDKDECESSSSPSYWWDAETMKSDPDQVPVLAQFYYDQYDWATVAQYKQHEQQQSDQHDNNNNSNDHHHKVRLNDIVEVIGILECNHGDDIDDDMDMAAGGDLSHIHGMMDVDERAFWDEDDTTATTPPRHIPRLHVLWFGFMDFDTIAAQSLCQNSMALLKYEHLSDQNKSNDDGDTINKSDTASQLLAAALEIDPLSATALYLNLMSMAERQPKIHGNDSGPHGFVTKTPSGATLGCSSLHLILPNHESCCRFQQRLESVLSQIVPTIHSIDILGDKNGHNFISHSKASQRLLQLPAKNHGRIQPTLWQLPRGSTLIINTSRGGSSSSNDKNATMPDPTMSQALEMLTMHHHLPYQFDGGVKIPFEADVRVIVLSSAAATAGDDSNHRCLKVLPCTVQAKCCFQSSGNSHEQDAYVDEKNSTSHRHDRLSEEQATFLRQSFARARGGSSNNNNIGLPSVVLERAQNDFIKRRTEFREREQHQQHGSSGTMDTTTLNAATRNGNRHVPDDMDLHRWLTWTRLFARQGRGNTIIVGAELDSVVATIQNWEQALALDDALMDSNWS